MKKLMLTLICLLPALGRGQTYSIDWYKIAGGGGTSSNGIYQLSGTVGQQDASNAMTNGPYALTAGFWSIIALVQTSGAPLLSIALAGNNVIVSWPYPSTGFVLQQNVNLSTGTWSNSSSTVNTNTSTNSVTIPSPSGNLFFRLKNP